uniref:Condensation domain-containing protein n=1 Tax=Scylla olivacea TaxID=85551 RepID=A0A0P4W7J8_SCYOL
MAVDSSFIWLRPATEMEELMDCANKKGLFVTVYGLTLRSSVPLTDSHIEESLRHTFRKVPSLRTCFRKRGDTLWACDMNREQLDFQVTDNRELVPVAEALLHYYFPTTEGPLWCARLLSAGAPGRCSRPDLAAAFPHTRTLLLANHHGIADGTTNMFVTNAFLQVLNDVLAGKPVDDTVQLGKVVAGEETKALLTAKIEELTKDKDRFKQLQDDTIKAQQAEKLIPRTYPMPRDPNFKCQIVLRDLDKDSTMAFIRKCKQEGVTVNSGLASVFNVSLVDFVREGGLQQDFYHIRELHTVSLRRNWSGDTSGTLGVHMMALENKISTPARWRDNFWEYARGMHKSLSQAIHGNDALMYVVSMSMGGSIEDHFKERPMAECDYGSANMGNADHLIPTEGQHVRLAHLLRVTSCWNDPMYYMFHTLHGCFMYSLTYASDILSRENAQKLVDKTFDNLLAVTQM